MPESDLEQERARHKQELGVQRQIAFASGLFQGDITVRTLLESLAEGVVIIDIRGTILLVNTLAEQMFGYPNKDLIGKPHSILIPERFRKIHEEHMAHFFAEPMIVPMGRVLDFAGRRQDGSEFPVEISLSFIETINGVLALAFVTDITLRKQFELQIRESEKLFRIQVEGVKDYAIFMLDVQGNVLTWNAGAERLKGYGEREIIGKHFSCFYPEEERNAGKPEEQLKKAAAGEQLEDEGWRVRKDGSRFWADVTITALRDENGNLRGFSKVTRDITGRKKVEDEVQDAREYAENIVETVREPLVVLNADLKILTANHSFYDTFKVTPGETIGNFIYDLGNRQWDIPKLRVLFEKILPHDTVINGYEVEHNFLDIGRKIILLNARQIFRKNIASHIILLAMEDITERKLAEERISEVIRQQQAILDNIPDIAWLKDRQGRYVAVNDPFGKAFGKEPKDLVGKNDYDIYPRELAMKYEKDSRKAMATGMRTYFEESIADQEGKIQYVEKIETPIFNDKGVVIGTIGIAHDITSSKEVEITLRHESTHDILTGLYNRAFFDAELERLSQGRIFPMSVVMADINGLKTVNDTLGHEAGDNLIRMAARIIMRAFRAEDIVARIGGDEFVVLLPGTDKNVAEEAVGRIKSCPEIINGQVSIAFGIASAENKDQLPEALKRSDERMYRNKSDQKEL